MKILHVLAQLPTRTGSGVYFSNMVEEFKRYRHTQKAIFAYQGENQWDILGREDQYPVEFKTKELPFPIVGMSDVMPYENTLYSDMTDNMIDLWKRAFSKRLMEARESFQPDIVFAHHLWILTSMVVEIFPDTIVIGLCHNTDLRQARMNPSIKDRYVDKIDSLGYIFSASDQQKDEIVEIYGIDREKIIAVGGAFNQNIFYPPEKKDYDEKIRLVYSGKIDPSKGIYELIDLYKSLNMEDISLDIIGSPNDENKSRIEKSIAGHRNIKIYNVKDQVALGDELRKKDIFIMPSYYEGLGLMAIESLACGLYTVTTEIEALMALLGDKVKKSGVIEYVPLPRIYDIDKPLEDDIPDFKEKLRKAILLQIDKIRGKKEFDKEIKEKIKEFSWEGLVANMNKILSQLEAREDQTR